MTSISSATFRKIVLGSAIYDLLVTAPFTTPWSFAYANTWLNDINRWLGGVAQPPFAPFHVLFASLAWQCGDRVVITTLSDPHQRFSRFESLARLLFSSWMSWAFANTRGGAAVTVHRARGDVLRRPVATGCHARPRGTPCA